MAKKNNRNYIGIEISPEYIDIINKRLTIDIVKGNLLTTDKQQEK
jgi:DNA modification methylase